MTLIHQFEDIIQATLDTSYPIQAIENNPVKCVDIADNLAIGFARYIHNNPTIFNNGWSMEMVLEFYKKEKGL